MIFSSDGEADWSIVSKAWWDAVDLIEKSEERGVFACDMTLELRVMGGSEVSLSNILIFFFILYLIDFNGSSVWKQAWNSCY